MSKLEKLISQRELRQTFGGVSDMTLWRWQKNGKLPRPVKISGRNYFRESALLALQQELFAPESDE